MKDGYLSLLKKKAHKNLISMQLPVTNLWGQSQALNFHVCHCCHFKLMLILNIVHVLILEEGGICLHLTLLPLIHANIRIIATKYQLTPLTGYKAIRYYIDQCLEC